MSISASIRSHRYQSWRLQRIFLMQWTLCMNMTFKNQLKECEENIQWLLHKKISSQGATGSHWRQCQRSKIIDYNFEWSSKFSQESCSSRKIACGEMHDWLMAKKKKRWQSSPNNSCQAEKEQEGRTFQQRIEGYLTTQ